MYNVLLKLCFMQEKGAKPTGPVALQISGPKTCLNQFVFSVRIHVVSRQDEMKNMAKRKHFILGVLQAAIIHTFSDYHPYNGNTPGPREVLATAEDIKMSIANVTNTKTSDRLIHNYIELLVQMRVDAPRAFYAAQLFKTSNVSETIQKNCDELIPGTYNQIDQTLGFSPGTNLWVGKVFNDHIDRFRADELWDNDVPRQVSSPVVMEYGRYFFATAAVTASLAALALTWRQKVRCAGGAGQAKVQMPYLKPSGTSAGQLFLCRGGECGAEEELMLDIEAHSAVTVVPQDGDSEVCFRSMPSLEAQPAEVPAKEVTFHSLPGDEETEV